MATLLEFAGVRPRIDPSAWLAPTAVVIGNVVIEAGASIWFGAVLRGDDPKREIRIGAGTSIQDNCVVHVSARGATRIGADVTVGHGAVLESCTVGDGSLIGMNAVVLQGARVGAGALIAAGAVVAADGEIPGGHLAAGAPAVVKKPLGEGALAAMRAGAKHYVELAERYRTTTGPGGE